MLFPSSKNSKSVPNILNRYPSAKLNFNLLVDQSELISPALSKELFHRQFDIFDVQDRIGEIPHKLLWWIGV